MDRPQGRSRGLVEMGGHFSMKRLKYSQLVHEIMDVPTIDVLSLEMGRAASFH